MVRQIFKRGTRACQGGDGSRWAKPICAAVCRCGQLRDVSGVGLGVLDGGAPWPNPIESSQGCKRERARFSSGTIFYARNMGDLLRVAASSNPLFNRTCLRQAG